MADTATSTPAPDAQFFKRPPSLSELVSLIQMAKASVVAVCRDESALALMALHHTLWGEMLRRPIRRRAEAQLKLNLLLVDLVENEEADPAIATIIIQVVDFLNREGAR